MPFSTLSTSGCCAWTRKVTDVFLCTRTVPSGYWYMKLPDPSAVFDCLSGGVDPSAMVCVTIGGWFMIVGIKS